MKLIVVIILAIMVSLTGYFVNQLIASKRDTLSAWYGYLAAFGVRLFGVLGFCIAMVVVLKPQVGNAGIRLPIIVFYCVVLVGMIIDTLLSVRKLKKLDNEKHEKD